MGVIIALLVLGGLVWFVLSWTGSEPTEHRYDPDVDVDVDDDPDKGDGDEDIDMYVYADACAGVVRRLEELSASGALGRLVPSSLALDAMVKIQLASPRYDIVDPTCTVTWDLGEGLRAILVHDRGGSERNITPEQIEPWAESPDALWARALGHSAQHAFEDLEAFENNRSDASGQAFQFLSSPSNFAAAMGLKLVEDLAAEGVSAVVGLPSWCNVVLRRLDDTVRRTDLEKAANFAATLHAQAVTPGVAGLYWHQADSGSYIKLEFNEAADGSFSLTGPPEFLELFVV